MEGPKPLDILQVSLHGGKKLGNVLIYKMKDWLYKDKRLKGKLLPVGSYYTDLKIVFPDEFDFLYELESLVEGKNFEIRPSGFKDIRNLWRTPNGNPLKKKVQIKTPEDYSNKDNENSSSNWLHKINGGFVLSHVGVKNTIYDAVFHEAHHLDISMLPRYLSLDSTEEATFVYGPATTLFFIWNGRFYKNLKISVDLTVCIKAENWNKYFDFLRPNYMDQSSCLRKILEAEMCCYGYHLVPHISDRGYIQWKLSTSYLETRVLSKFPKKSPLKQVIRIVKFDKEKFLKVRPDLGMMNDKMLADFLQLTNFYSGNDYDENFKHLVSSYVIKNVVFHLCGFATCKEWNKASLSTLYLLTLTTLYGGFKRHSIRNFYISQHNLTIPDHGDILPGFQKLFGEVKIESYQKMFGQLDIKDFDLNKFESQPFEPSGLKTFFKITKDDIDKNYHILWESKFLI
ncbi:Hypothetical predicted protein [Mytilus galloprovincialis]|uniref:Mab-21-like HhH/H2TH-like domain-containing protein n=1 Tax=Mytilus galloprovincialis TaxID=29158 RepID=A0A8B6GEU2_MYTGA|nr:Hypothetical predicted protein [Mytilus galloprovincialis]